MVFFMDYISVLRIFKYSHRESDSLLYFLDRIFVNVLIIFAQYWLLVNWNNRVPLGIMSELLIAAYNLTSI